MRLTNSISTTATGVHGHQPLSHEHLRGGSGGRYTYGESYEVVLVEFGNYLSAEEAARSAAFEAWQSERSRQILSLCDRPVGVAELVSLPGLIVLVVPVDLPDGRVAALLISTSPGRESEHLDFLRTLRTDNGALFPCDDLVVLDEAFAAANHRLKEANQAKVAEQRSIGAEIPASPIPVDLSRGMAPDEPGVEDTIWRTYYWEVEGIHVSWTGTLDSTDLGELEMRLLSQLRKVTGWGRSLERDESSVEAFR